MSIDSQSSYKQILKAISIFGGVQVINIIISIVRSKFIAALLGPIGIGISGMLTATTGIISGLTNFGLGTSAVRDISAAYESGNTKRIAIVANVLHRWVWITGLLGMILTLLLSPWLSYLSFGNYDYTIAFLVLSITLLINQLNSGHLVVLQGSRKISLLAKANLAGSVIGLFITIPLYYVWGIDGIVPALVIAAIVSLLISYFFRKKVVVEKIRVSKVRSIAEGKQMLKMGFLISLTGLITLGFSYIVRIFITREGNLAEVGLYNAGFAIISVYVGLIFTAMATDYYPRLSAVADDIEKANETINSQIEIALIILGPILVVFILFIKWIIQILYSNQFLAINTMLVWAALGMLFKAVSWSIAFFFLAKGSSNLFFWNELITNIYLTALNINGYYYWGLTGLGYAFALSYFIYMTQVYVITNRRFNFTLGKKTILILVTQLGFVSISIFILYYLDGFFFLITSVILLLSSIRYSLKHLSKRIDFKLFFCKSKSY
ncbi:MAG: O-antigen translocase [Bacteroidota bacterium]